MPMNPATTALDAHPPLDLARTTPAAYLVPLLGLALAYFVGGRLGLLLAVPPGYASAVWPASGIAVGALLVFGWRVWPGVLAGSFCLNAWMSFDGSDSASIVRSTLVCLIIALGAALQALAGCGLVRRCAGPSPVLDEGRAVVAAMLLGGPLCCLLGASVGVGTLFAVGAIPAQNVAFNWFNWWVGDSIGVLIFMPLVLVACGRPRAVWRPRALTVALPTALAISLVVVLFVLARSAEDTAVRQDFERRASAMADGVAEEVSNNLGLLHGVERFFAASDEVNREEFRAFVLRALQRRPGLTALSWNPVVSGPDRDAFTSRIRAEGFPDFEITEAAPTGGRDRAGPRTAHVVIDFIEPLAQNRDALGFDVASEPQRRAALELARDSGRPAGTGTIPLVQGAEKAAGMLVFMPVYRNGAVLETPEARRSSIVGFVVAVLRFDDLLSAALRPFDRSGVALRIRDLAAPPAAPPLRDERGGVPIGGDAGAGAGVLSDGPTLTVEKELAGRRWSLSFAPTQAYLAAHRRWHVWLVLAGGLTLTAMLGVFLLVLTGRTMRIAVIVDERTTELSRANAALGESQRRFELAVEGSSVGIWEWTIATDEDYFSPRWKALLGYRDEELSNVVATWSDRLHPDDKAGTWAAATAHLERREVYDVEYRLRCKDGDYRWFHARGQAVWDADGKPVKMAGSLVNVDARKRAEEMLERAARADKLTGLPNRALLLDRVGQAIKRTARNPARGYAVLFLDFDRFKLINDTLGHDAGDQLLIQIAERLRAELRTTDSISPATDGPTAARLGGDEFVVLLEDLGDPADATLVATRLVEAFARPYEIAGQSVVSTASIGVVIGEPAYQNAADALRDADVAMYEAKVAGKARYVVFDATMRERVVRRAALERDLTGAAERGEMILHYQPIIHLETGRTEHAEALLRWRHPSLGSIGPAEFIPIAEESGQVVGLGDWVFREASIQARRWRASLGRQHAPTVAVNLFRQQLATPDLAERLAAIAREAGVEPAALSLEITEAAVMRDSKSAIGWLKLLRAAGFRLALDDFGTGHSSLASLHTLPLDVVKLDCAFVAQSGLGRAQAAMVHAVTSLAANLGLQVVAEGVETPEQLALLQTLDCRYAQGYLLGKPGPAEMIEASMASRRAAA